jgi:hypothetical protein
MTALTYDLRKAAATTKAASPAKKGFWARTLDALIEARMRQAEREIRLHRHLLPASALRELGLNASYKDAGKLPFVK